MTNGLTKSDTLVGIAGGIFKGTLGKAGAVFVTISIILFAFSTILGWEYNGEKALEFLFKKPIFCYIYRVVFSLLTSTLSR